MLARTHKDLGLRARRIRRVRATTCVRASSCTSARTSRRAAWRAHRRVLHRHQCGHRWPCCWETKRAPASSRTRPRAICRAGPEKARSPRRTTGGRHARRSRADPWQRAAMPRLTLRPVQRSSPGSRYGDLSTHAPPGAVADASCISTAPSSRPRPPIPPVLVFTGHMIDQPERPAPRFPTVLEPWVRDSIQSRLVTTPSDGGVRLGGLRRRHPVSRGNCLRLGGETHVILPFPPAEFCAGQRGIRARATGASASSARWPPPTP